MAKGNYFSITRSILGSPWCVEPKAGIGYLSQFFGNPEFQSQLGISLNKSKVSRRSKISAFDDSDIESENSSGMDSDWPYFINPNGDCIAVDDCHCMPSGIASGAILVITLDDVITKDDLPCGDGPGTESILNCIKAASKLPELAGILLDIDSPGGEVLGTPLLSDTIKALTIPKVAYVNGMACSAAYYIGCAADWIIASDKQDLIGSIGVMLSLVDATGIIEKQGGAVHTVYSSLSAEKNAEFEAMLDGNYKLIQDKMLDPLANRFQKTVTQNRPNVDKAALSGAAYFASDAIINGLIDELGTFESALAKVQSMTKAANSNPSISSVSQSPTNMKFPKALTGLATFLGINPANAEASAEHFDVEMTSELQVKLNAALVERETSLTELHSVRADLSSTKTALNAVADELNRTKAELATAKAVLEGRTSDAPANEEKDPIGDAPNPIAELPHNKAMEAWLSNK